ncbi:unnamed protein product [Allacma fusca]|uniref:Uncharacterized protein n=1 Tax=Allacma fusca TaxID=39272 RepID=A0A8J2KKP8_9HEXA|nr:unnamed protein product [Allacma fusca]
MKIRILIGLVIACQVVFLIGEEVGGTAAEEELGQDEDFDIYIGNANFCDLCVIAVTYFIPSVITRDPNVDESAPNLTLKSYKTFAEYQNITVNSSSIFLPRVFNELIFECRSTLPTKWNFFAEQLRDPSVKKIEINKWHNHTTSTELPCFISTFKVKYSNPNQLVDLSCENVCPKNKTCRNLNTFVKYKTTPKYPAYFILEYGESNKTIRQQEKANRVDHRLGWNDQCRFALHVDLENGKYACTEANNTEKQVPSIFVPCGDPDECATVIKNRKMECNTTITFHQNCTSDLCAKLLDTSKLFILACGENNNNSVARGFFKPLGNETSRMYEYNREMEPGMGLLSVRMNTSVDETCGCKYVENKTAIYTGYHREFTCSALKSFFSFGIQWKLIYENKSEINLAPGRESTNEITQTHTSINRIRFNDPSIKEVVCVAPNWNSVQMTEFHYPVNVTGSIKPCLTTQNCSNPNDMEIVKLNISNKEEKLTCNRTGEPPAQISWRFDGVKSVDWDKRKSTSIHYNQTDDVNKSEVYLSPEHPFNEIVCVLRNGAGSLEVHFLLSKGSDTETTMKTMHTHIVIIVCSLAAFLLITVVATACWKIRKQKKSMNLTEDEIQEFQLGNPDATDAFLVPYNMELEVPLENFTASEEILGIGAYGKVVKGLYGTSVVAIKTLKKTADVGYLKALLSELKIMSFVGRHSNVVNLLGASTQNIRKKEIFIILEYCELGNMVSVLQKNRGIFQNYFEIEYADMEKNSIVYQNHPVKRLTTFDLIRWAYEIALGMDFLSAKNVIHGDLAGRNILITKCLHAKVSDFGLSKQLYEYTTYVQKVNVPLPLRWMAYESLKDLKFSIQSDVWSYGVVMWEIFSLGETPYPGMEWGFGSWKEIQNGKRNDMPPYASQKLYKFMLDCWNIDPKGRPTFQYLWKSVSDYSSELEDLYEI